jgi:hypothetical protein
MNNRFIVSNHNSLITENQDIDKLQHKECCLVCGIITCFNFVFIGIMIGLIQGEDLNLNSTIF